MEKNSRVKHSHPWGVQGGVTSREGGRQGEKNYRVKGGCQALSAMCDLLGDRSTCT